MNRHYIFLSFFIMLAGTVAFGSCAKSASVSNKQAYAEATPRAGSLKSAPLLQIPPIYSVL